MSATPPPVPIPPAGPPNPPLLEGSTLADPRRVAANIAAKALSLVVEKGAQLALPLVGAPMLGVVEFGRYSYAASVSTLFAFGTDLGLTLWTTRALARDPAHAPDVLATSFRLRLMATLPYLVCVAAVALALGPGHARVAMLALGVASLARALLDHARAMFRAHEEIGLEGRLNAVTAVLASGLGLGALLLTKRGLPALALGVMGGTVAGGGYGVALFRRRHGRWLGHGKFERALAGRMLREALPFWLAGLFALGYSRGDVVILRHFAGEAEVGAYRAAGQLFEVTKNLPLLVLTALFPQLARDFRTSRERLARVEDLIVAGLLVAGVLVAAILALGAGPVVRGVFGPEFARTVPALRILSLALPLLFLNFGLTHFLVARDLGVLNLLFSGLMVVVSLIANLVLAPRLGSTGAAWATLATEASLALCCVQAMRKLRRADRLAAAARAASPPAPVDPRA
ncbi:MAG TPA: oligosaccharide flippase family protein [Polyangia bacterium]